MGQQHPGAVQENQEYKWFSGICHLAGREDNSRKMERSGL
jgi:hypothetical protein